MSALDLDVDLAPADLHTAGAAGSRAIRVGLLGYGNIGQAVAAALASTRPGLHAAGLDFSCTAALVRDVTRDRGRHTEIVPLTARPEDVLASGVDVIVEALGGVEPARTLIASALRAGVPVVSANKSVIAAHGPELCALAAAHGTSLRYEAAVVAGVPFIGALSRRPRVAALRRVTGILNGTSHFIVSALASGLSFEQALADAQARGFAEPDSDADLSGRDAAEKLTILLQLAGLPSFRTADLPRVALQTIGPNDLAAARLLGGTIKPVAIASLERHFEGAWVGPAFVGARHPFARLEGVANAVEWTPVSSGTVTFAGPGAGPDVTAMTIVDDVIESITGGRAIVPGAVRDETDVARLLTRPPSGGWLLRLRGAAAWRATDLDALLTSRHLPALRLVSCADEWFVRTSGAAWTQVQYVLTALRALGADVAVFPVIDAPGC